jgi:tetratricopeptide (TPR) repeat protein
MPPCHAVHRTIMVVDVERFGDRCRTNPQRVVVRDALYEGVQRALAEAGIFWAECWHEGLGDGVLVLVPAEIPKARFVEIVPGVLAAALRHHNQCHPVGEQIRLRMALHAGEVQFDRHGVTSAAVNHTFRLLDAEPLKTALADSSGELALITSSWFFEDVVRHSLIVDPATFRPARVSKKETSTVAWIALPDHPFPSDPSALTVSPPEPTARPVSAAMFSMRGDIPDFAGRHDELRILIDTVTAVTSGPVWGMAVCTVDGMPGVGKTAFSVYAAHRLAEHFPDGQIFLELYGHSPTQNPRDPADALASLLAATGMDQRGLPNRVDDRARLWRDRIAGKKVLLVLDDAASHDQLRPLLPGTLECFVVITSRHRLPALDGAHALTLDVLPPDQAAHMLLTLAHRDLTRVDSAMAVDVEAVARVVELCGYLPLAIALVAGRLRTHPTWSIAYLANLLAQAPDRLENLAAGDRSTRAAFAVSYQHLTDERQRIFILLGVHPGPSIDAYALTALADCSLPHARQHLEALHADHLIQETAPGRYQLHDLLRVYADSLAVTAEHADTEAAMRRVLDYYLYTATNAGAHIPNKTTPALTISVHMPAHHPALDTPPRARAWLDAELATLATCLEHSSAHPDLVIALAATLHDYLWVSGAWDQAHRIHHTALAAAEHTHDEPGLASALSNLGDVYYLWGDYARAQQLYDQAHQLYADLGNRLGQATSLNRLGYTYHLQGDWERAVQLLDQAHKAFINLGDRLGQAYTLTNLGMACRQWGDWGRAQQVLDQAHQLYTDLGNRRGQANALLYLGTVYHLRGDSGRAHQMLNEAHHLFTDLGARRGQAITFLNLGRVHHQTGDHIHALDFLTQAHALYTAIGYSDGQVEALNSLGDLALDHPPAGDPHALFTQAQTLACTMGAALHEAHALAGLGRCAHRTRDVLTAITAFTQALTIYRRLGSPEAAAIADHLAELHNDADQTRETT